MPKRKFIDFRRHTFHRPFNLHEFSIALGFRRRHVEILFSLLNCAEQHSSGSDRGIKSVRGRT